MTLDELEQACRDVISRNGKSIILVLPIGGGPNLCGRRGPRGELICCNKEGDVRAFKAKAVLRFIANERGK